MRAVHGDLVDVFERREAGDPEISDPHGDFQSFDLVAMCVSLPPWHSLPQKLNAGGLIK